MVLLVVYSFTLAPTVTGEDSGELITAAYYFGVPHPPGYPLWTMLCGAWMHSVPFGSVAWRANLFSAVCMSGAVVFLFRVLRQMQFRSLVAGCAVVACGVTAAVWSQSVIAETYTLNLLLMAILMWLFARWQGDERAGWLMGASLAFGLGMSNHHLIGFAALALGVWALSRRPALLRNWRLIARCVAFFGLGLLPYAYLLWAGPRDVPVNWGETATVAAVWEHASRGQYKSDTPIEAEVPMTAGLMAARLYYGLRWEVRQFTPILVPLLAAGMVWLWRRRGRRALFWCVVLLGLCCGPLYLYVGGPRMDRQDEFVQKVFLTPLALVSAVPLAAGLQWLVVTIRSAFRRRGRAAARAVRAIVVMGVIAVPLVAHWRTNNMRHYWYAHDHAKNMLAGMLPNAVVFPSGDHNTFPLIYLIHVEGKRPDVLIGDKYGYIELDLYKDMPNNPGKPRTREEREAIEEWIIRTFRRPVYFTVKKPSPVENARTVPVGLLYHLLPAGKAFDSQSCWRRIRYRNLDGLQAPEDHAAANILADYYYALGMVALDADRKDEGKDHFATCLDHAWGIKEIYNNVASALAEYGLVDEAIGHYEEAARMDWRYGPARWNLAKIFRSIGKFAWSAKVFEDLTRAAPGDFRPYGELGFLYRNHFGDLERARYWWHESLRINPRQSQIIAALAESQQAAAGAIHTSATDQPTTASAPAEDMPTSQPGPDEGSGRLAISEDEIDFGTVVEGQPATHVLSFRNTGNKPLTVTGVEASCACVVGEFERKTHAPGESGELTVGLKTAGKRGRVTETLTVKSDDPIHPALRVTLRAYVVPEVTADPPEVRQAVLPGRRPEIHPIALTDNLGKPFEVRDVTSSLHLLRFDWPRGATAATHIIGVSCTAPLTEEHTGLIEIHTTLPEHKVIEVPLHLALRLPVEVQPSLVYLGRIGREDHVERTVAITAVQDGLHLELKLAETDPVPGLDVRLRQADKTGSSWALEIRVDGVLASPGVLKHTVRLAIAGCDRPVEVPVYGHVAE